jgi:single-stranded DNA-binding protein
MLRVLIEGTLVAAPVQRTGAKGQRFVTAQMRTTCDDGDSILCSVIAFHASAIDALAALGTGDTVAVAGPASISRWEKDGEQRVGLKVTATRVMTVYDAGMRRRAASQDRPDERHPALRAPEMPEGSRSSPRPPARGYPPRPRGVEDDGPV